MQKKVNLAMLALFSCSLAMAQNEKTEQNLAQGLDENAFTFSEAQLGEDDVGALYIEKIIITLK